MPSSRAKGLTTAWHFPHFHILCWSSVLMQTKIMLHFTRIIFNQPR